MKERIASSKKLERSNKPKVLKKLLKKPDVRIQPWLNSSVWDHGSTIPLKYYSQRDPIKTPSVKRRPRDNRGNNASSDRIQQPGKMKPGSDAISSASQPSSHSSVPCPSALSSPADEVRASWSARFPSQVTENLN